MSDRIHLWEAAGLGGAPFKLVGIVSLPSPSLAAANPSAYNAAMADIPKGFGVGSCAYCGRGLVHNALIESADGKHFSVGCDCVEKVGELGMVDRIGYLRREAARKEREAAAKAEMERRQAAAEAAREAERAANGGWLDWEWDAAHQANEEFDRARMLEPLAAALADGRGGFRDSVAEDLRRGNVPWGRGRNIAVDILAKMKGRSGSKAYEAEADRVEEIFDKAERKG